MFLVAYAHFTFHLKSASTHRWLCTNTAENMPPLPLHRRNKSGFLHDEYSHAMPGRVWSLLLIHAGEQLKYTRLNEGYSSQMNRKVFDLLAKANVIHKIPACDPSGLPLGATANPKKFKASMLDIGLMQRLCQVPVELELQQENLLAMYRGKLAEQFVAQELLAWHSSELFYWARETRGSVVPR